MRRRVVDTGWLIGRDGKDTLELQVYQEQGDHVIEGLLQDGQGVWYPIQDGVPNLLRGLLREPIPEFEAEHGLEPLAKSRMSTDSQAHAQALTNRTFSDKWRRFKDYGLQSSHQEFLLDWYCKKLGLRDLCQLKEFYQGMDLILELGPGSGFNSRFMAEHCRGDVVSVDVSEAALTTFENTRDLANCHVLRADLMDLPLPDLQFDFVIADGVLHHTPDTRKALRAIYRKLRPGGQLFFYVYRKMGPARVFCDEHLREQFSQMEPEACYEACEGLTELGKALSGLAAEIDLPKAIPALGIPAGKHDVQRLFYYYFLKCFWNDHFDFETNNMVNFDWYHPHNAWQHAEEEVAVWLDELGVEEYQFNPANPNGISTLLKKPM